MLLMEKRGNVDRKEKPHGNHNFWTSKFAELNEDGMDEARVAALALKWGEKQKK